MVPQHHELGAVSVKDPLSIPSSFLPDCFSARPKLIYTVESDLEYSSGKSSE